LTLIARVLAAATEKEQPESLVKTRGVFNEAGHVFLDSEVGVAEYTRAELGNPGEPIQVPKTDGEGLPATHGVRRTLFSWSSFIVGV
jgi:hypothetical protein